MRTSKLLKARILILLSLVAVMSLAAVAVAQASTPTPSSGSFWTTGLNYLTFDKVAGQNTFYSIGVSIEFSGTLKGTGVIEESGVIHGGGAGPTVGHAVIHFTGTIGNSAPGTIDIRYNRKKDGGLFESVPSIGDRVFVTNTGAGGLANLHGTAHFEGLIGEMGSYEGQYHFD